MSAYLQTSEATAYGLPAGLTIDQIRQASALIDANLLRPEGLVWLPDYAGMPCDMDGLSPSLSLTLAAPIAAGLNVTAQVAGPVAALKVGDVVVLDRATQNIKEACTIVGTGGPGSPLVTLDAVANAHSTGGTVDLGLIIEEQKYLPAGRPITFVSKGPVARMHSGVGRYGYGRRGEASNLGMEQFNLLSALSHFGGPPAWEIFSPTNTGVDAQTGQVWVPAGVMLAYFSEVKLRYVAGFQASAIPAAIKWACASVINATLENPMMLGNVKSYRAGDTQIEGFSASVLSADTQAALSPYRARLFV